MIVYLVSDGEYSDYGIKGVYSTTEKAQEAKEQFNSENDIEEFELDSVPAHPKGLFLWEVSMRKDGSLVPNDSERWKTPLRVSADETDYEYLPRWSHTTSPSWKNPVVDFVDFYVWAKDREHAAKVAHERWAQLIATNEWTDDFNLWIDRIQEKEPK